jgi:hypothetical protein
MHPSKAVSWQQYFALKMYTFSYSLNPLFLSFEKVGCAKAMYTKNVQHAM